MFYPYIDVIITLEYKRRRERGRTAIGPKDKTAQPSFLIPSPSLANTYTFRDQRPSTAPTFPTQSVGLSVCLYVSLSEQLFQVRLSVARTNASPHTPPDGRRRDRARGSGAIASSMRRLHRPATTTTPR